MSPVLTVPSSSSSRGQNGPGPVMTKKDTGVKTRSVGKHNPNVRHRDLTTPDVQVQPDSLLLCHEGSPSLDPNWVRTPRFPLGSVEDGDTAGGGRGDGNTRGTWTKSSLRCRPDVPPTPHRSTVHLFPPWGSSPPPGSVRPPSTGGPRTRDDLRCRKRDERDPSTTRPTHRSLRGTQVNFLCFRIYWSSVPTAPPPPPDTPGPSRPPVGPDPLDTRK